MTQVSATRLKARDYPIGQDGSPDISLPSSTTEDCLIVLAAVCLVFGLGIMFGYHMRTLEEPRRELLFKPPMVLIGEQP